MRIRILIDEYDYIVGRDYYNSRKKEWPYERIFSTSNYIELLLFVVGNAQCHKLYHA
jgi:hypothetical protein